MNKVYHQVMFNETLKVLLTIDSNYDATKLSVAKKIFNKEFYEMHPFILERLPVFYFHYHNVTMLLDINNLNVLSNK